MNELISDTPPNTTHHDTKSMVNTIWITGASSGIGRALALRYAAAGHTVYASARSVDRLATLSAEAVSLSGSIQAVPLDVTDTDAVNAVVDQWIADSAVPDIAVLNAGFYSPTGLDELTLEHFEQTFAVNYMGVVKCMMALMPHYREKQTGHLVLVSSVAGYAGLPRAAAYGSSKAALINLAESMKPECDARNIKVTVVNPGFVKTPMTDLNDFNMPFQIDTDTAAERMFDGISAGKFEITFPRRFTWMLKFLRILPYPLFFPVVRQLVKDEKHTR